MSHYTLISLKLHHMPAKFTQYSITPQPYSRHTTSQHRQFHIILYHTTGILTPNYITLQAYSHHIISHNRHIHIILYHTTGIFSPYSITPQAYPYHATSHHRLFDIILYHTAGIITSCSTAPQSYSHQTLSHHAYFHIILHYPAGVVKSCYITPQKVEAFWRSGLPKNWISLLRGIRGSGLFKSDTSIQWNWTRIGINTMPLMLVFFLKYFSRSNSWAAKSVWFWLHITREEAIEKPLSSLQQQIIFNFVTNNKTVELNLKRSKTNEQLVPDCEWYRKFQYFESS